MMRKAALALTACTVLASMAPAHADSAIGLSHDGVHWADALTYPLFDPEVRWVPGDVRTARFYVRNEATQLGDLSVDVDRVERDELLDTGQLAISARAGGGPWSTINDGGLQELLDEDDLSTGEPIAIDVRVAMSTEAPNVTMVLATDLDFRVTIRDARVTSDAGGGDHDGDGHIDPAGDDDTGTDGDANGVLPGTGSDIPRWLPPAGFLMLTAGAYLVLRRRTSSDDEGTLSQS